MNKKVSKGFSRQELMPLVFSGLSLVSPVCSAAITLEELAAKVERLDAENRALKEQVNRLESANAASQQMGSAAPATTQAASPADHVGNAVRFNLQYSYQMLDPTTNINRKHLLILESRKSGELADNSLILGGAVTAVADHQTASASGKFGYLMRQPGAQVGTSVSEAVIHSSQLQLTATLSSWVTTYGEILYDPQQSFGAGSITALSRNQLQLRNGYVLFGNLAKSPYYVTLGKMATPFGLTDTVNPFSASTVWHAFGGLAYGMQGGYSKDGLNIALMAVQGGAQFRGANTPVDGTNVPSKLNNYVVDANYTLGLGGDARLLAGASYERGSIYCQGFPVSHFGACQDNNPAYDIYGQLKAGRWVLQAEFAKTFDEWPGTFNPALSQFAASKVSSLSLGGKYRASFRNQDVFFSAEFSRFTTGPAGSPWENQDQMVLGVAGYIAPSVKLFGEYVRVNGFVPLPSVGTISADSGATSNVFLMGVNAAY